jgi:hypothetical protein
VPEFAPKITGEVPLFPRYVYPLPLPLSVCNTPPALIVIVPVAYVGVVTPPGAPDQILR